MRTLKEIYDQIDLATTACEDGGKFPALSYEEGVKQALEWVIGNTNSKPMEE